jgi:hypothetical protein
LTKDEAKTRFIGQSLDWQARVLAQLVHEITLAARAAKLDKQEGRGDADWLNGQLMAYFETIHVLIDQLAHLLDDSPRYGDDDFIEVLFGKGGRRTEWVLAHAFDSAYSRDWIKKLEGTGPGN